MFQHLTNMSNKAKLKKLEVEEEIELKEIAVDFVSKVLEYVFSLGKI